MTNKNEEEKIQTKLERATEIKQELMKEGVHYGKIQGATSDFLWLNGASLLADVFEIDGIMSDVSEVQVDGQSQITVTIDMLDRRTADRHCVGVGTWDSGEMLGNRAGARQRGIAMAYKRAYVMGVRYATSSHGLFSQDDDLVKSSSRKVAGQTESGNTFSETVNMVKEVTQQMTGKEAKSVSPDNVPGGEIPMEMDRNSNGELIFVRFGSFVKGRTIAEVLDDPTLDEKSGVQKGLSYLNWILSLDDASQELKNEIVKGIEENASA
jgi:hypothetical protein